MPSLPILALNRRPKVTDPEIVMVKRSKSPLEMKIKLAPSTCCKMLKASILRKLRASKVKSKSNPSGCSTLKAMIKTN